MSNDLTVTTTDDGTTTTIQVSGELDADNCATLTEHAGAPTGPTVLDLSDLGFIDSSGVSAIIALRDTVAAAGGSFSVHGVTGQVARVFDIAGLNEYLAITDER